jgi:hypothetical protein
MSCTNDIIFYRRQTTIFTMNSKMKQFYFVCYWRKKSDCHGNQHDIQVNSILNAAVKEF